MQNSLLYIILLYGLKVTAVLLLVAGQACLLSKFSELPDHVPIHWLLEWLPGHWNHLLQSRSDSLPEDNP